MTRRSLVEGVRRLVGRDETMVVEGRTYDEVRRAAAAAYSAVRPGGRIEFRGYAGDSDVAEAVEAFRFEHGALPLHVEGDTAFVDVLAPKDPAVHFAAALREKWSEVPVSRQERAFSTDLAGLDDDELLLVWERHRDETSGTEVRGWYQQHYRDRLSGKRVLDFGSGFGVDGIFFAQHGAKVTFADIVPANLEILARVAQRLGVEAETYYIDDFFDYEFESDFDAIMAIGSLINAPLPFTKRQVDALVPFLVADGAFMLLGYPKERFLRMGVRDGHQFGIRTDGERTPWCEWLDRDRVRQLFGPEFEVVLERGFGIDDAEFNWFELTRR